MNEDRYGQQYWRFLSTLSLRRATRAASITPTASRNFYPRSPCGERLIDTSKDTIKTVNFYPRSPCGERHDGLIASANFCKFLSTLSLRRATRINNVSTIRITNFYPRSPCGERRRGAVPVILIILISIHALLAESDYSLR